MRILQRRCSLLIKRQKQKQPSTRSVLTWPQIALFEGNCRNCGPNRRFGSEGSLSILQNGGFPMNHRIKATHIGTGAIEKKPGTVSLATPVPPTWPSYTGQSQFVGTSPSGRVAVYVDPTLGDPALQNGLDLISDADRVTGANDALFGTAGGPVSVIVFALGGATDGTGGADHMGCDYSTGAAIEVCASFNNSARVSALFEAELSECSMGGNLCGVSTGEALSRWCAAVIGNNALVDFATAPAWAQDGMPDYVNQTDPTDRSADSTGCGMAFLSWMMKQGYSLNKLAQTMVSLGDRGTLAQL